MSAEATQDNSVFHRPDSTEATFRTSRQVSREQRNEHFAAVAPGTDAELIDAKAGVTWRALRYQFPRYEQWCKSTGRTPLPCDGEQLRD
jgi:hypothetical protein